MRYLPKSPAERQEMLNRDWRKVDGEELSKRFPEKIPAARCVGNCPGRCPKPEVIDYFSNNAREKIRLATQAFWAQVGLPAFAFGDYRYDILLRGEFSSLPIRRYQAENLAGHAGRQFLSFRH